MNKKPRWNLPPVTRGKISGDTPGHSGIHRPDSECEHFTLPGTSAPGEFLTSVLYAEMSGVFVHLTSLSNWS